MRWANRNIRPFRNARNCEAALSLHIEAETGEFTPVAPPIAHGADGDELVFVGIGKPDQVARRSISKFDLAADSAAQADFLRHLPEGSGLRTLLLANLVGSRLPPFPEGFAARRKSNLGGTMRPFVLSDLGRSRQ
ncbi:hypothetical protein [uncultured Croceicoccus sp.]|uniref:hypothetical protein n=1 Tax=uncultured Croceicoccus sp. TaxID=1295329 RepID=UPI0026292498|nr:hypothetical protein [uncultured Croceicoccus sp.]